jgi:hypothetical protein
MTNHDDKGRPEKTGSAFTDMLDTTESEQVVGQLRRLKQVETFRSTNLDPFSRRRRSFWLSSSSGK